MRGCAISAVRLLLAPSLVGDEPLHLAADLVGVGVDAVQVVDGDLGERPLLVEQAEVLLPRVEEESHHGLAVVVVEEDGAVPLGVAHGDARRVDLGADDGLDDAVAVHLLVGGHYAVRRLCTLVSGLLLGGVPGRCWVRFGLVGPQGGREPVVHLLGQESAQGLRHEPPELDHDALAEGPVVDVGREQLHELVGGVPELLRYGSSERADVLELLGAVGYGVDVERGLGELLQLGEHRLVDVQEVEYEEGLRVHAVGLVQVHVEVPDLPVGEHADARAGAGEVAVELTGVLERQLGAYLLALDEDLHLVVEHEGVVDLLALLHPHVGGELGNDLPGVEDVVAEGVSDERHDEGVLGCLLRLDAWLEALHLLGYLLDRFLELHLMPRLYSYVLLIIMFARFRGR